MYYKKYNGLDILSKAETPYEYLKKVDILLIRHGESEVNALQDLYKKLNKPLTEDLKIEDSLVKLTDRGIEQAKELGTSLNNYMLNNNINKKNVLVLVSPYIRTKQTFEIANKFLNFNENSNNIFLLNSLVEQSFGAFHMISKDVKKELFPKIYEECYSYSIKYFKPTFLGESPFDVCNRLWNVLYFIENYIKKHSTKSVFIFGHGNANKCLFMNILNLPPEFYNDFPNLDNSSIINIKKGKFNSID